MDFVILGGLAVEASREGMEFLHQRNALAVRVGELEKERDGDLA